MQRRTKENRVRTEQVGEQTIHYYRMELDTGETLDVPTFIVRNTKLRGWQIRINRKLFGYHSEFFSDSHYGEHPEPCLRAAIRRLKTILIQANPQRISGLFTTEKRGKRIKVGVPGVRPIWHLNKGHALFELRLDVRAGKSSHTSPEYRKRLYVGSENQLTEQQVQEKLHQSARARRKWMNELGSRVDTSRGPKRKIDCSLDDIERELVRAKESQAEALTEAVRRKVKQAVKGYRHLIAWRGVSLRRKEITVGDRTVEMPWFVNLAGFDGDLWEYEFPMPDGSIYVDSTPVTEDSRADLETILEDCFMAYAFSNRPIERETVHGMETPTRFSTIPAETMERINTMESAN